MANFQRGGFDSLDDFMHDELDVSTDKNDIDDIFDNPYDKIKTTQYTLNKERILFLIDYIEGNNNKFKITAFNQSGVVYVEADTLSITHDNSFDTLINNIKFKINIADTQYATPTNGSNIKYHIQNVIIFTFL